MLDDVGKMDGYLLLADVSGYTKFLTGTELEHSHAIVTELTKLIRARLVPPMRFVKLEGDAVFCFAGVDAFPDGERLLELVEFLLLRLHQPPAGHDEVHDVYV